MKIGLLRMKIKLFFCKCKLVRIRTHKKPTSSIWANEPSYEKFKPVKSSVKITFR